MMIQYEGLIFRHSGLSNILILTHKWILLAFWGLKTILKANFLRTESHDELKYSPYFSWKWLIEHSYFDAQMNFTYILEPENGHES